MKSGYFLFSVRQAFRQVERGKRNLAIFENTILLRFLGKDKK
jgi:hypothetical protein